MLDKVKRQLERLEARMAMHDNVPRFQIRVVYYTTGADGKPVPTGESNVIEIPPQRGGQSQ
jgi:hypothetical protein